MVTEKNANGLRHAKRGGKRIVIIFNNRKENKFIDEPTEMF